MDSRKIIPKKSLGQHFLKCRWVIQTIIHAAEITGNDTVLEIGPGTGILTRALAKCAKNVIAIEKDERLADALRSALADCGILNVKIIRGDILHLHKHDFRGIKVVGNIPYYLTSRLMRMLLESERKPEKIVCTIQKEVAQRIAAKPPRMNLLAVSVQVFSAPKIIKKVPPECFSPKPKVDSAIISISDIHNRFFQENSIDKEKFFKIVRYAFSRKRKILLTSLKKIIPEHEKKMLSAFERAGIKNTARPEELSIEKWREIIKEAG